MGYLFPRKAGWGVILLAPLLGPATFTFVPSSALPLTTYRIAFAITMGIALRVYSRRIRLIHILKSHFVKLLTVFTLLVAVISLGDRTHNIIFTYLPNTIFPIVLCFIIIRKEEDLFRLVNIFVWQAALIGLFIVFECYTSFDIHVLLRETIPGYDISSVQSKGLRHLIRSGIYRAGGIDGNSVITSYRLSFLFPLVLWYAFNDKGLLKLWKVIPLLGVLFGLARLQTRFAFVAIIIVMLILVAKLVLQKRISIKRKLKKLTALLMFIVFVTISTFIFYPKIGLLIKHTFIELITGSVTTPISMTLQVKKARIPVAINHFLNKPFLGYGSPHYAYEVIMKSRDVPAPFIYLLAGGTLLCLIYLSVLFYMPLSVFRLSRKDGLSSLQREFITYAWIAFVGGIVVVFSNWAENHFMIMYMLYISIYKVYLHQTYRKHRTYNYQESQLSRQTI